MQIWKHVLTKLKQLTLVIQGLLERNLPGCVVMVLACWICSLGSCVAALIVNSGEKKDNVTKLHYEMNPTQGRLLEDAQGWTFIE